LIGSGYWLLVVGKWLLEIGYWRIVIGKWLLGNGYWLVDILLRFEAVLFVGVSEND